MRQYRLKCEFHIYLGYQQSKHADSSQSKKDPYQWKDNNLKDIDESGFLNLELMEEIRILIACIPVLFVWI
jgi:hypothetical protein